MEKGNTVAAVNQTKCVADCENAQSTYYWLNLTLITLMNLMKQYTVKMCCMSDNYHPIPSDVIRLS